MARESSPLLNIGWASADITPDRPVIIAGQFHARVSEGVMDPLTATALALESVVEGDASDGVILVSCDLGLIPDTLRDSVRGRVAAALPGFHPRHVCVSATHVHSGPELRLADDPLRQGISGAPSRFGLSPEELGVMAPRDYSEFAAQRIAEAVVQAWNNRRPGGVAFGLGQAVIGRNRRVCYLDGTARMYGKTDVPEFSHIEGYEDHGVNLLCTYDTAKDLTGMVVNVACTAQVSESIYRISADFWHETRVELRSRLGENLFVLPQCSAAGDLSPHVLINRAAEARMLRLKGRIGSPPEKLDSNLGAPEALRAEIAQRIADTVTTVLPAITREIDFAPAFAHRVETVLLPRNKVTEADVREANEEAAQYSSRYEELRKELEAHPENKQEPRWYREITMAFSRMGWFRAVETRFRLQQEQPRAPVEITAIRLGDLAIATSPFEYYLDFGMRIKARSPAVQTFVVELAGTGTYLPTERAVAGRSYGAVPASNPIGPEGGQELVERTLEILDAFWATESAQS